MDDQQREIERLEEENKRLKSELESKEEQKAGIQAEVRWLENKPKLEAENQKLKDEFERSDFIGKYEPDRLRPMPFHAKADAPCNFSKFFYH